ncbi:Morn repeat incomplete domain containing protein [Pandoravirus salinus]|uniref:Morn repeat incomplete domain containing protein n=1 Tax=Pandoravirus salinus TaxID=1349410 RepID=S4VVU5_9VIRU|nr:morn repeat incomplete domain [Pandoravirus salinus]AGO84774.1 Morn repeat incomplete domain containing protein [Pandoravirus salinus]
MEGAIRKDDDDGNNCGAWGLEHMPAEIVVALFGHLAASPASLVAMRATSTAWRFLLGNDGPMRILCRGIVSDDVLGALDAQQSKYALPLCLVYATLAHNNGDTRYGFVASTDSDGPAMRYCGATNTKGQPHGHGFALVDAAQNRGEAEWFIGKWDRGVIVEGLASTTRLNTYNVQRLCRFEVGGVCLISPDEWRSGHIVARWTGSVHHRQTNGCGVWEVTSKTPRRDAGARSCIMRCSGKWTYGGRATVVFAAAGHVYTGKISAGEFDGSGSLTLASGSSYRGQWHAGYPHGRGVMNDPHGDGDMPRVQRMRIGGIVDPGRPRGWYKGPWYKGRREGADGTHVWPDGRSYKGAWRNDCPHGDGTETLADGTRVTGTWVNGTLHGPGWSTTPAGHRHRAYWIDGRRCSWLTHWRYKRTGRRRSTAMCVLALPLDALRAVGEFLDEYTIVGDLKRPLINF